MAKKPTTKITSMKRSVTWWTWPEFKTAYPQSVEAVEDYEKAGWRACGRLTITQFVDGAVLFEMPMRRSSPTGEVIKKHRHFMPAAEMEAL